MNQIIRPLKKYSSQITMYALYAAAFFALLAHCGNFMNAFMPVVGNLFLLIFDVALLALIPLCMTLKKTEWAKIVFIPVLAYWTISTVYNFLSDTFMAQEVFGGLTIAVSVFEFLIALAVIGGVVLYILAKLKKNAKFEEIVTYVFMGVIGLFFITFILNIAKDATQGANWNSYFFNFRTFLALPVAMFFAYLTFVHKDEEPEVVTVEEDVFDETAAEPTEEPVEESKTEPQAEEVAEEKESEAEQQEETVAEDKTEE